MGAGALLSFPPHRRTQLLSHQQLATFTDRFPKNNRPVQPRNKRDLEVLAG